MSTQVGDDSDRVVGGVALLSRANSARTSSTWTIQKWSSMTISSHLVTHRPPRLLTKHLTSPVVAAGAPEQVAPRAVAGDLGARGVVAEPPRRLRGHDPPPAGSPPRSPGARSSAGELGGFEVECRAARRSRCSTSGHARPRAIRRRSDRRGTSAPISVATHPARPPLVNSARIASVGPGAPRSARPRGRRQSAQVLGDPADRSRLVGRGAGDLHTGHGTPAARARSRCAGTRRSRRSTRPRPPAPCPRRWRRGGRDRRAGHPPNRAELCRLHGGTRASRCRRRPRTIAASIPAPPPAAGRPRPRRGR